MRNLFLKLLETGNIRFDDDRLMILNAFQMILPISVFLKLRQLLLKKNKAEGKSILKELGSYQIKQGLQRYKKVIGLEGISLEKSIEFLTQHASLLGFGKYNFVKFEDKPVNIIITSSNNPLAIEYKILYGKSKEPIDDYFVGILEELYSSSLNKNLKCIETACIAKGDKVCQFEIKEKKKSKH